MPPITQCGLALTRATVPIPMVRGLVHTWARHTDSTTQPVRDCRDMARGETLRIQDDRWTQKAGRRQTGRNSDIVAENGL